VRGLTLLLAFSASLATLDSTTPVHTRAHTHARMHSPTSYTRTPACWYGRSQVPSVAPSAVLCNVCAAVRREAAVDQTSRGPAHWQARDARGYRDSVRAFVWTHGRHLLHILFSNDLTQPFTFGHSLVLCHVVVLRVSLSSASFLHCRIVILTAASNHPGLSSPFSHPHCCEQPPGPLFTFLSSALLRTTTRASAHVLRCLDLCTLDDQTAFSMVVAQQCCVVFSSSTFYTHTHTHTHTHTQTHTHTHTTRTLFFNAWFHCLFVVFISI
jgi:hypothetical protein